MSFTDLADLGQFISSLAVLASLIYVAVQIRQTERNQRAAIQAERSARATDLLVRLGEKSNAEILTKGSNGDGITTPTELSQFQYVFSGALYSFEDTFLQHRAGLIGDGEFEGGCRRVSALLGQAGSRLMWSRQRAMWSGEFAKLVDGLVRDSLPEPEGDPIAEWHKDLTAQRAASAA